ncbi:hypothetical protein EDL98_07705 [Ornithobacterium rhinotracheale]|uniref:hypothetical protein n=1 Tax=Ornithobacterium rhinotracheale TaxID=28251 RepID=UPI00129D1A0C|nr:hypothetical protein [Ornithobacterium rhinotracheale]MRJ08676.1 hypothetical protein [Ornithobacterium rhinotracheale]MRJ10969.1 hypothetical protein [Ornithobacterium rhinotracheale]UOH76878.1 hypothetical protein MT996_06515 [Ornithobacterium rhinotracheale]
MKKIVFFIFLSVLIFSCKNSDDDNHFDVNLLKNKTWIVQKELSNKVWNDTLIFNANHTSILKTKLIDGLWNNTDVQISSHWELKGNQIIFSDLKVNLVSSKSPWIKEDVEWEKAVFGGIMYGKSDEIEAKEKPTFTKKNKDIWYIQKLTKNQLVVQDDNRQITTYTAL